MKHFVTVTQITSTKFDVEFLQAETSTRIKPKGMLITVWERNEQNERYCFNLAELMNNNFKQ